MITIYIYSFVHIYIYTDMYTHVYHFALCNCQIGLQVPGTYWGRLLCCTHPYELLSRFPTKAANRGHSMIPHIDEYYVHPSYGRGMLVAHVSR